MRTFSEVIARWGSIVQFSEDLRVKYPTAAAWSQRNSIPPEWWTQVETAARRRGLSDITVRRLAEIAQEKRGAA